MKWTICVNHSSCHDELHECCNKFCLLDYLFSYLNGCGLSQFSFSRSPEIIHSNIMLFNAILRTAI